MEFETKNYGDRTKALIEKWGPPGEELVMADFFYPMILAWDKRVTVNRFQCHKKVADRVWELFNRIDAFYGAEEIEMLRLNVWGGCFNYRNQRGGDELSTHSWGIALDIDPFHNRLHWGSDRASLAQPAYKKFWELVESCGGVGHGPTRGYDWMHIEFPDPDFKPTPIGVSK